MYLYIVIALCLVWIALTIIEICLMFRRQNQHKQIVSKLDEHEKRIYAYGIAIKFIKRDNFIPCGLVDEFYADTSKECFNCANFCYDKDNERFLCLRHLEEVHPNNDCLCWELSRTYLVDKLIEKIFHKDESGATE